LLLKTGITFYTTQVSTCIPLPSVEYVGLLPKHKTKLVTLTIGEETVIERLQYLSNIPSKHIRRHPNNTFLALCSIKRKQRSSLGFCRRCSSANLIAIKQFQRIYGKRKLTWKNIYRQVELQSTPQEESFLRLQNSSHTHILSLPFLGNGSWSNNELLCIRRLGV